MAAVLTFHFFRFRYILNFVYCSTSICSMFSASVLLPQQAEVTADQKQAHKVQIKVII